jgi:hypothetical protein
MGDRLDPEGLAFSESRLSRTVNRLENLGSPGCSKHARKGRSGETSTEVLTQFLACSVQDADGTFVEAIRPRIHWAMAPVRI